MRTLLALLLLLPAGARAAEGVNHGGGGSDLVSLFRDLARQTLDRYDGHSCGNGRARDRGALRGALADARVVSVNVLLDPVTQQPIPHQGDLLAWGSPGFLQLKKTQADGSPSWEDLVRNRKPVAHHVLHELYRVADLRDAHDLSPDDGYQISMGSCQAQHWPVLSGGEIRDFTCSAAWVTSWTRRSVEANGTRRNIELQRRFTERAHGVWTDQVHYALTLTKSAEGVRVHGVLEDRSSHRTTELDGAYFRDDQILAKITDVQPPAGVGLTPGARETVNLQLSCTPNYEPAR